MYPNCMPYHDPSSSGSPDILLTRLLYYTKQRSWKRQIIQSNIYRILPKVNQVIYTLDTICEPNIMTLAQAVLELFCSQGSIGLQWESRKNVEKGLLLCNDKSDGKEKSMCPLNFCIKFQDHIYNGSWPYARVTHPPTHAQTSPNQYAPEEIGGIKVTLLSDSVHCWIFFFTLPILNHSLMLETESVCMRGDQ